MGLHIHENHQTDIDEIQKIADSLGATESQIMPLDETLALMVIMDELRATWGVRYPVEVELR